MDIRHYLDDTEIDEPIGFEDLELSMRRDDKFHGMQFEASTGTLEFYGEAAAYLKAKKQLQGLRANVIYRATATCEGDTEAQELVRGRLNFGKYKDTCGTTCRVTLPVEEDSCQLVFKSRFDQKVDMDSTIAFDKVTGLPTYAGLGIDMEIPAKALSVGTAGNVREGSYAINDNVFGADNDTFRWIARPDYDVIAEDSIQTGYLIAVSTYESNSPDHFSSPISPQLLMEDRQDCFPDALDYEFTFSGSFLIEKTGGDADPDLQHAKLKVVTWNGVGLVHENGTVLHEEDLGYSGGLGSIFGVFFDKAYSGTVAYQDGIGLYAFIEYQIHVEGTLSDIANVAINTTFGPSTSVTISARKLCPPTTSQVYLIHEALSRVAEAVTNRCMRVKSDYYGRIDSQPFAAESDGCGSLRFVTSGLKLRQAPDDQDKFFVSAKDMLEGLWAIDNIGFAVEPDTVITGFWVLRVEDIAYFYQDSEILALPYIPQADSEVQESKYYSRVLSGYKKWEVEEVNGLGEPNSNREYRTSLDTVNNTLDITSILVAGSYAIEITRQQSFAESGAADTTYDNDVFIVCVERDAYSFHVEQGNITSPANLFDPATILNWRLTPARNTLRWARSIFNSYPGISSSQDKIFFSAGTGNIIAQGQLDDPLCRLESGVLAENQDITPNTFAQQADYTPLWRPEYITFEYPLSVAQYQELKANPYGTIAYGCGSDDYEYGFIREIKFRPMKGKATFTLIKKW